MAKWGYFFLAVPILGLGIFLYSLIAPESGLSLPENVSPAGKDIDLLYYLILAITGLVFAGTQFALAYVLFKYGAKNRDKATYFHGSQKLEIIWTVIPAVVLLIIAMAQMPTWVALKFPSSAPRIRPHARVVARQFEWRVVYPGPDGELDTLDDVHVANELRIPKDRRILIELRTMDVLHSFFLPHLRVKQDAVPGLSIPVWFEALKSTRAFQSEGAKLDAADIPNVGRLVISIAEDKNPATMPLSQFLVSKFSPETMTLVKDYQAEWQAAAKEGVDYDPPASSALQAALISELNGLLSDPELIAADRIKGLNLSAETKDHMTSGPGGVFPVLLGREVLQEAYPDGIKTLERHYDLVCAELCGWGHYKMKGRLVVQETQEEYEAWISERYAQQEAAK